MPTVLLQVEVGGHALLHRQAIQVALLGLHRRIFADLEQREWNYRQDVSTANTEKRNSNGSEANLVPAIIQDLKADLDPAPSKPSYSASTLIKQTNSIP